MRMLLFMLLFVLLTACERDDPVKRCQREFGAQGQDVVDKCVRWAVAPTSGRPEKINLVDALEFASPSIIIWEWSNVQNGLAIQTSSAS